MKDQSKRDLWNTLNENYKEYLLNNKKPIKIKKTSSKEQYQSSSDSDFTDSG